MNGLLESLPADRLPYLVLAVIATIAAYELLRLALVGTATRLLRESVRSYVDRHRVQIDLFKYSGRQLVKEELLNDVEVVAGIVAAARAGEPPAHARARVDEYIEEIIPRFSLTAYFKFGFVVARTVLRLLYRVEHDKASFTKISRLPANASVMYLMNHRSNADYLLVAVALARRVAISFAIGEWARVFPLELLFKLFGGYFLRRNFRDPLYHTVLRRYLQLIVRRGVTQGLFPEGKLSRDGRPGDPKIGLLDAMVSMAAEPNFDREIVFVPVGLNYDRVLEDNFLLTEGTRAAAPPTRAEKRRSTARIFARLPGSLLRSVARLVSGRLHRFGYASVSFGDPFHLSTFAAAHGHTAASMAALPKEERRPLVKALADELMGQIGRVTPATPVPLTCRALLELGGAATKDQLDSQVGAVARRLREAGTPVVLGHEFEHLQAARADLAENKAIDARRPELAEIDDRLIDQESAEESARIGLERLRARGIVQVSGESILITPGREALVRYYAWSLAALPRAFVEERAAA